MVQVYSWKFAEFYDIIKGKRINKETPITTEHLQYIWNLTRSFKIFFPLKFKSHNDNVIFFFSKMGKQVQWSSLISLDSMLSKL